MENIKTEYRSGTWEGNSNGHIAGCAIVFEKRTVLYKDNITGKEYGEIIDRHALDSADMSDVVLRYNHAGCVLARTRNKSLKLNMTESGLFIDADLSGSDEGRKMHESVSNGLYDKMSFAFTVAEDDFDSATNTRRIKKIDRLFDVSIVDFPAYEQTTLSARSKFETFAEPERRAFQINAVNTMNARIINDLDEIGIGTPDCYDASGREGIMLKMAELRQMCIDSNGSDDTSSAEERFHSMETLKNLLVADAEERQAARDKIINGAGNTIKRFEDNSMNETKSFYDELIEKRSATNVAGMGNVIPSEIIGQHLREGKNGMYDDISITTIAHAGAIKIPYIADSSLTVNSHTENASITPAGTVPGAVTITHSEYECTLGYSFLGNTLAASQFEDIINNALISAMRKKLDAVSVAAVNALTWVSSSGATQNAVQWASSGNPKLSEIITLMGLLPECYASDAKLYMSRATSLALVNNSTGLCTSTVSNGMYNVDLISGFESFLGVPIVIDSNIATGDILYGNANAVHLNVAGDMFLNNWLDHDSLTEKMQIACAAGAGCETGAFVKGSNSFA